jgi:uncharacterized phiE125 gp8 family phage protein
VDLIRVDEPTDNVLQLEDVKVHLRVPEDDTSEDDHIRALISGVEDYTQTTCKRAMMAQAYEMYLTEFPDSGVIRLPFPPLLSVDAITYFDSEGAEQTLATDQYIVNAKATPARVSLAPNCYWPSTQVRDMAVKIAFSVGHDTADEVPDRVKAAMLLYIGDLFENREASIVGTITAKNPTAERLLSSWKLPEAY